MKISLLIPIIAFLLFCSCVKQKAVITYAVDSNLVKYFNYKSGTYWVYRDSIAGEVDSFYVTKNFVSYYEEANHPSTRIEDVSMNIIEVTSGIDTAVWTLDLSENDVGLSKDNSNISLSPLFVYPFTIQQLPSLHPTIDSATNVFSSYIVGANNFSNTEEIHHKSSYWGYDNWYYISTDAGIVKMRWSDTSNANNKVWELQRWNIVR